MKRLSWINRFLVAQASACVGLIHATTKTTQAEACATYDQY
jgi:hypothetical protein